MPVFAQPVHGNGVAGMAQRRAQIARRLQRGDQRAGGVEKQAGKPLLLAGDPLLIKAREQRAGIKRDGSLKNLRPLRRAAHLGNGRDRRLELGHIRADGLGVQPDRKTVGANDASGGRAGGRLQLMAQRGQGRAEPVAGGGAVAAGPQHFAQHLARVRAGTVIRKIRQQGGGLLGGEAGDHRAAILPHL